MDPMWNDYDKFLISFDKLSVVILSYLLEVVYTLLRAHALVW